MVFAHERGGKAQAASGLHFGTQTEHRSRQQVHFVVNHQAPLFLTKEREVREFLLDFFFGQIIDIGIGFFVGLLGTLTLRQNLVGRHRHGADFLDFAGVFLHLVESQVRLVANFTNPLTRSRNVRRQNQGLSLYQSHRGKANHGLTRTARQHNHARTALFGTARVEHLGSFLLVVAESKRLSAHRRFTQVNRKRIAHGITGQVFHRETRIREGHLQVAAAFRVHFGVQVVNKLKNERFHLLEVADFGEHVLVIGFDNQLVAFFLKTQQTITVHVILNFRNDGFRNREATLAFETFQNFGCTKARRSGVPQAEGANLVGMQMLGALDQFGERGNRVAGSFVGRGINLHHNFHITLNNNGAIRIHRRQI